MLGNDVVLCIVANKIDLEKDRHVSIQVAEDYAKSVNAKLYHTSAKLSKGIEELFNDLAQRMLEKVPSTAAASTATGTVRPTGVPIQSAPAESSNGQRNGGCC